MIRPVTTVSGSVAHLSLAAGALFLVLLVVLHILKPEYDPSWRMISEYEIGYIPLCVLSNLFRRSHSYGNRLLRVLEPAGDPVAKGHALGIERLMKIH